MWVLIVKLTQVTAVNLAWNALAKCRSYSKQ